MARHRSGPPKRGSTIPIVAPPRVKTIVSNYLADRPVHLRGLHRQISVLLDAIRWDHANKLTLIGTIRLPNRQIKPHVTGYVDFTKSSGQLVMTRPAPYSRDDARMIEPTDVDLRWLGTAFAQRRSFLARTTDEVHRIVPVGLRWADHGRALVVTGVTCSAPSAPICCLVATRRGEGTSP